MLRHRPVHLLRTAAIFLAIFAAVKYWHPSPGTGRSAWLDTSAVEAHLPSFPVEDKPSSPDFGLGGSDTQQHPVGLASDGIHNQAAPPPRTDPPAPAGEKPKPGPQSPAVAGTETSDVDTSPLPLPTDYRLTPAESSDFCLNRFTSKWFDLIHAGHNQYCLASAASRFHCFHTPSNFRNDGHIDSFCVAQNAVFDPEMDRFTLDCPLTVRVPQGMPKTPIDMHEYWYETGPRAILLNYIAIDDRAEIVQHRKVKGPISKGPWKKREEPVSHESSPEGLEVVERQSILQRAVRPETPGPRTFTLLLKRESAHNPFHVLHELMSLQLTFDTLRSYRDPSTNAPFYIPREDFGNTQIVITDTHADGPLFELLGMFGGRKPKRLIQLTHKGAAEAATSTGQEDYTSWLKSGSLDNVIIPYAGGANSVWHDNWEKWDCRYELRQVFAKRVLEFYGFKLDDDDEGTVKKKKVEEKEERVGALARRGFTDDSKSELDSFYEGRTPKSPTAAAGAASRAKGKSETKNVPLDEGAPESEDGSTKPKSPTTAPGAASKGKGSGESRNDRVEKTTKPDVPSSGEGRSRTKASAKVDAAALAEAGASGSERVLKQGLEDHMEKVMDKKPSKWDDEPAPKGEKATGVGSATSHENSRLEPSDFQKSKAAKEDMMTKEETLTNEEKLSAKEDDAPDEKPADDADVSSRKKPVEDDDTAVKDKPETSEASHESERPVTQDSEKEPGSDEAATSRDEKKEDGDAKKEGEDDSNKEEGEKPKFPEGPSPHDGSSSPSLAPPTLKAADLPPAPANAIVITFIERKDTRRITTHLKLVAHARKSLSASRPIHIQSLDFAQYSFRDQIAIARSTDILVGVHGAGLTHTMFMRQGVGALVEIFPEGLMLRCFQAMAKDREMGYFKMVAPVVVEKKDWHEVDVVVEEEDLMMVLREAVKAMG